MKKQPISVCIIAKNEEKFLEECLKRIKPWGFEIIVTDTGSTDRTKEIAAKYADKVLDFPWINDFSAARNYCAEHTSNNWIISLDCDEFLERMNIEQLLTLTRKYPKGIGTLHMKILLLSKNQTIDYSVENVARIYNKKYFHYESAIHEQIVAYHPEYDKYGNKQLSLFVAPLEVVHQGYAQSQEIMDKKQERNLEILLSELDKNPDNAYVHFQVAQSLKLLGRVEEALPHFEKTLSYHIEGNLIYIQLTIIELIKSYVRVGRIEDAKNLMESYDGKCNTAKFTFIQACFYFDSQEWMKSLFYFLKTINMKDVATLGADQIICYQKLIELYTALGDEASAEPFKLKYEECKKENERVYKTIECVNK